MPRTHALAEEHWMKLPADAKVIGQAIKARLEGVEQEPLLPEMENVLRDLGEVTAGDLGKALGEQGEPDAPSSPAPQENAPGWRRRGH